VRACVRACTRRLTCPLLPGVNKKNMNSLKITKADDKQGVLSWLAV
jgi:hypothetical protein